MANMEGAMVWRDTTFGNMTPVGCAGHRFALKDEELIRNHLEPKVSNINHVSPIGTCDDFYNIHPGILHGTYPLMGPEDCWYFYMTRDTKYPNGCQDKVEKARGYWKVCNASRRVNNIGFKRRLNFRNGSVNSSKPSQWFMEEFGLKQFVPYIQDNDWVLLKIYKEDGNAVTPLSTTSSFPLPLPQFPSSGIPAVGDSSTVVYPHSSYPSLSVSSINTVSGGSQAFYPSSVAYSHSSYPPSSVTSVYTSSGGSQAFYPPLVPYSHSSSVDTGFGGIQATLSSPIDTRLSGMEAAWTGPPYSLENFLRPWDLTDHDYRTLDCLFGSSSVHSSQPPGSRDL